MDKDIGKVYSFHNINNDISRDLIINFLNVNDEKIFASRYKHGVNKFINNNYIDRLWSIIELKK